MHVHGGELRPDRGARRPPRVAEPPKIDADGAGDARSLHRRSCSTRRSGASSGSPPSPTTAASCRHAAAVRTEVALLPGRRVTRRGDDSQRRRHRVRRRRRAPEMRTRRRSASSREQQEMRHALRYVLRRHGVARAGSQDLAAAADSRCWRWHTTTSAFVRGVSTRPSGRSAHRLPPARVQGRSSLAPRRPRRLFCRRHQLVSRSAARHALSSRRPRDVNRARVDCRRSRRSSPRGRAEALTDIAPSRSSSAKPTHAPWPPALATLLGDGAGFSLLARRRPPSARPVADYGRRRSAGSAAAAVAGARRRRGGGGATRRSSTTAEVVAGAARCSASTFPHAGCPACRRPRPRWSAYFGDRSRGHQLQIVYARRMHPRTSLTNTARRCRGTRCRTAACRSQAFLLKRSCTTSASPRSSWLAPTVTQVLAPRLCAEASHIPRSAPSSSSTARASCLHRRHPPPAQAHARLSVEGQCAAAHAAPPPALRAPAAPRARRPRQPKELPTRTRRSTSCSCRARDAARRGGGGDAPLRPAVHAGAVQSHCVKNTDAPQGRPGPAHLHRLLPPPKPERSSDGDAAAAASGGRRGSTTSSSD